MLYGKNKAITQARKGSKSNLITPIYRSCCLESNFREHFPYSTYTFGCHHMCQIHTQASAALMSHYLTHTFNHNVQSIIKSHLPILTSVNQQS